MPDRYSSISPSTSGWSSWKAPIYSILKKLLDQKAWERRILLSEVVRGFWAETRQSEWEDYNPFEQTFRRHVQNSGKLATLTAADIKHLRLWLTGKDPDCAPVIAETIPAKPGQDTLFGLFPREDGKVRVYEPDPDLREFENVPLKQDIRDYFTSKVLPHVPDAWIDAGKRDPNPSLLWSAISCKLGAGQGNRLNFL